MPTATLATLLSCPTDDTARPALRAGLVSGLVCLLTGCFLGGGAPGFRLARAVPRALRGGESHSAVLSFRSNILGGSQRGPCGTPWRGYNVDQILWKTGILDFLFFSTFWDE